MDTEDNNKKRVTASMLNEIKEKWITLNFYERFEYTVGLVASIIVSVIIVVALIRLLKNVTVLLVFQMADPLDYKVFQTIFGMLLTLLIALEFRNSITAFLENKSLLTQVRIIVLIGLIALARKFIVVDIKETEAATLFALATMTLSLGIIYWLIAKRQTKRPRIRNSVQNDT